MSQLVELRHLPAPAKLNLFLHITGRRPDGYHLLETVFQLIDLHDLIDLRLRDDGAIQRPEGPAGVAPEADLGVRAARLLQQATGCRQGCEIRVRKSIPMGGGLGGGSSDAATVLLGLNRLWGLGLSRHELAILGLQIGADVPVFVHGNNAFAAGVGEKLTALDLPERWFVVLRPDCSVPTAAAFGAPELRRDCAALPASWWNSMPAAQLWETCLAATNALQDPVAQRYPPVAAALASLQAVARNLKLAPEHVKMSGSGSCVFIALETADAARKAARLVRESAQEADRVWCVRSLVRHPLL
jgi:4-diphosphocytidyl-2-C-methyl-D-erythritol kinase